MNVTVRKLLFALAFSFAAIIAPAALLLIDAANAPRPEVHDPAYARTLLAQGRLAWENQQASASGSTLGDNAPEPGSGE